MLEQIVTWGGIALIIVWLIATFATQIMYLIASFRVSVGLTLLSLIIPFVGIYVLIKFWEDLKGPFAKQIIVGVGGFVLILGGGMALQAMGVVPSVPVVASLPKDTGAPIHLALSDPASTQDIQELPPGEVVSGITPIATTTGQPAPVEPAPVEPAPVEPTPIEPAPTPPAAPAAESWGTEVAVRDAAVVTVPTGWSAIPWTLPDLALAMGDKDRGEYVTIQVLDKDIGQSFADFQQAALQAVLLDMIEGSPPTQSRPQTIDGCEAITFAMGGRSKLPNLTGHPMSARISCIDGQHKHYCILQWRTAAWDGQSIRNFDRLLNSFAEIDGE